MVVVASDIPPLRELVGPQQICAIEADAVALRGVVSDSALRDRLLDGQTRRRAGCSANAMVDGWRMVYETIAEGRVLPLDPTVAARPSPTRSQ